MTGKLEHSDKSEFKLTQQEFLMNEIGVLAEAVAMGFNNPLLHRTVFRNMMIEARIFIAKKEDDIPF